MIRRFALAFVALFSLGLTVACGGANAATPEPITKPFLVKDVKIEGGDQSEFVRGAVLSAILQNGGLMSKDGTTVTGKYETTVDTDAKHSVLSVRITVNGVNETGPSLAGSVEISERTLARYTADFSGNAFSFGTFVNMATQNLGIQFRDEVLSQQRAVATATTAAKK